MHLPTSHTAAVARADVGCPARSAIKSTRPGHVQSQACASPHRPQAEGQHGCEHSDPAAIPHPCAAARGCAWARGGGDEHAVGSNRADGGREGCCWRGLCCVPAAVLAHSDSGPIMHPRVPSVVPRSRREGSGPANLPNMPPPTLPGEDHALARRSLLEPHGRCHTGCLEGPPGQVSEVALC